MTELDQNQLICRTIGHGWEQVPFIPLYSKRRYIGGIRIAFRCIRCKTIRNEAWSRTGQLLIREYRYPEGYTTIARDVATKETFRAEMLTRNMRPASAQRARKSGRRVG